jgi:glutamate 5-kinase
LLDLGIMKQIVGQIVKLKKQGIKIVVVSSGAMGAGRGSVKLKDPVNEVVERQILASVGQVKLMDAYNKLFSKYGYNCAQVLATKGDFGDRSHYLNMKTCFEALLWGDIVPVLNENDVVAVSELMFTDNDELAGLIASMLDVDELFLLTDVEGLYRADAGLGEKTIISEVLPSAKDIEEHAYIEKSLFGRGGMHTKCRIARKLAGLGITTYILDGRKKDIIINVMNGQQCGTTFVPSDSKVSSVKKWIAHSDGQEKGVVHLNQLAEDALTSLDMARSLLPIGITKVDGDFEKGDIIKIKNHKGEDIGFGMAEYGAEEAGQNVGEKGKKELVHYDYLFLSV